MYLSGLYEGPEKMLFSLVYCVQRNNSYPLHLLYALISPLKIVYLTVIEKTGVTRSVKDILKDNVRP